MDEENDKPQPRLTVHHGDGTPSPPLALAAENGARTEAVVTKAVSRHPDATSEDFLKSLYGIGKPSPTAIKTQRGWREWVRPANEDEKMTKPRGI